MIQLGPVPVLDIGGTHVTAAHVDLLDGTISSRHMMALDSYADASTIVSTIVNAALRVEPSAGARWGIAIPGPFDYQRGAGSFAGGAKFHGIAGRDLKSEFASAFRTGSDNVRFVNDADAYALGEWHSHGRPERLLCVTLGTGVGAGFIRHGLPVTHDDAVPVGGNLYQLTWQDRPLEDTVSRRALIAAYGEADLDVRDIARLALDGDMRARAVFEYAMTALADVLAPWIKGFAPQAIVVGGSIARSWSLIGPPLESALEILLGAAGPRIARCALDDEAPLLGAAFAAQLDRIP